MDAGERGGWTMSKLNQTTNLRVEDFPEQASWIGRLFVTLNQFIQSVQNIFDYNIDFATNIRSVTREFDTTSITFPITFQWTFTQVKPQALTVLNAMAGTSATCLVPAWSYDSSTSLITVSYLTEFSTSGVSAPTQGTRYKFSLRATV